jgi:hypothetical protein
MPRRLRSQSRRRTVRRRRIAAFVGVVGITGALLVASFSLLAPEKASDRQVARNADFPPTLVRASAGAPVVRRAGYPYSVVPGGVHSSHELALARADRVVAAHYAAVDLSAVRVDTVRDPRRVHVSYRIGDEIYWTKRTVLLSPGERILTDGRTEIRSRCGNIISDTPQGPTSDQEPSITEFDRALVPVPGDDVRGPDAGLTPPSASGLPPAWSPSQFTELVPEDELAFAAPSDRLTPTNMAIGGSARREEMVTPEGFSTAQPSLSLEPTAPGLDVPGDDHPIVPPDPPPLGIPLSGPPSVPQPLPVPEPGSILLVATGLAGGAWRGWRRRRVDGAPPL